MDQHQQQRVSGKPPSCKTHPYLRFAYKVDLCHESSLEGRKTENTEGGLFVPSADDLP